MKKTALFMAVGALTAITSTAYAAPYHTMHSPTTGNNYVAYSDKKTAVAAESFCQLKQGHLAVLNSHAETVEAQKYLDSLAAATSYYLGGIHPAYVNGEPFNLITVTGQSFYQDTAYGTSIAATNDSSPDYQSFMINGDPNFDQFWFYQGGLPLQPFICEFEDSPI